MKDQLTQPSLVADPPEAAALPEIDTQAPAEDTAQGSEPVKTSKARGKAKQSEKPAQNPGPYTPTLADWTAIKNLINEAVEGGLSRQATFIAESLAEQRTVTEPRTPLIFGAIRNIMRGIEPLAKEHEHATEKFFFRTIDEVCALLQPLFVEHGLFCVPEVLEEREIERVVKGSQGDQWVNIHTKVKVKWHLYCAIDGSSLPYPCVTMGEGVSEMHFSTAAAQTMAFKQMLWEVFAIPVRGVDDPEGETVERSQGTAPKKVYVTPQSTTPAASGPGPVTPGLFDEPDEDFGPSDETPKKKRTARTPLGPQTTEAGVGAAEFVASVPEEPLTAGFVKMLESTMKIKGVTEAQLFEHFQVQDWTGIKKSQMAAAQAWIGSRTQGA